MEIIKLKLLCLFFSFCIIETKFYEFYASYDGCDKVDRNTRKIQDQIKYLKHGVDPDIKSFDGGFVSFFDHTSWCGYLALEGKEKVSQNSGVRIGYYGIDLADKTEKYLSDLGVDKESLEQLKYYYGLKGDSALQKLVEIPLNMNFKSLRWSDLVVDDIYNKLETMYNNECESGTNCRFSLLDGNIRTALFSLYYSTNKIKYSELWPSIIKNDWLAVAKIIESFPNKQRRQLEAQLIRVALFKCHKKTYTSIIIDINDYPKFDEFQKNRDFINLYLNSTNPTDNYVSLISYGYTPRLVSNFTNNFKIISTALNRLLRENELPFLHKAVNMSRLLLQQQPNDSLKVMIIMSDGGSQEQSKAVSEANEARENGIKVIPISFDSNSYYNSLEILAGGKDEYDKKFSWSHSKSSMVDYLNGYFKKKLCIDQTVKSTTLSQNNKTSTMQANDFEGPLYYEVNKTKLNNQNITLVPKLGDEAKKINMFVSYSNPYPSEISNDLAHFGNNKGNKEIIISGNITTSSSQFITNTRLRLLSEDGLQNQTDQETVYISVYGQDLSFNLVVEECDPSVCKPGTNDSITSSIFTTITIAIVILIGVGIIATLYYLKCYKRTSIINKDAVERLT